MAQRTDWGRELNYLLGTMNAEEREEMREQLLTDHEAFDRLREAENDLFDAYARNDLTGEKRAAFERTLLRQPGAAAKLRASRALVASRSSRFQKWWWISAAFAAGLAAFYFVRVDRSPVAAPPPAVIMISQTFRLEPITRGASNVQELLLATATGEVELIVDKPAGPAAASYPMTLETASGSVVSTGTVTAAPELRWRVQPMPTGAYVLRVGTKEQPLAFYEFRVVRR